MKIKVDKINLGRKGETIGKEYLVSRGYEFLASNYHTKFGEIDLIFKDEGCLVLVEVKTRRGDQLLEIERTINKIKIKKILKSAEIYISESGINFKEIRVDAIFIKCGRKDKEDVDDCFEMKHIKGFY